MARDDSGRYSLGLRDDETCKEPQPTEVGHSLLCERVAGHGGPHAALVASEDMETELWLNENLYSLEPTPGRNGAQEAHEQLDDFIEREVRGVEIGMAERPTVQEYATVSFSVVTHLGEVTRIERTIFGPQGTERFLEALRDAKRAVLQAGEYL